MEETNNVGIREFLRELSMFKSQVRNQQAKETATLENIFTKYRDIPLAGKDHHEATKCLVREMNKCLSLVPAKVKTAECQIPGVFEFRADRRTSNSAVMIRFYKPLTPNTEYRGWYRNLPAIQLVPTPSKLNYLGSR